MVEISIVKIIVAEFYYLERVSVTRVSDRAKNAH